MAGQVLVNGQVTAKADASVSPDAVVALAGRERYVSRGGLKLEGALDHFGIDPAGRVCIDIGASTGGFTDCLLQRGAVRVFAVDVGHGQLAWSLRKDARVEVREGVNARVLPLAEFEPRPEMAVGDVSFISLTLILPAVFDLLRAESDMVFLIKPQFELTRAEVGRGGIVRDPDARLRAVEKIRAFVEAAGRTWLGFCESSITGRDGNVEFLAYMRS